MTLHHDPATLAFVAAMVAWSGFNGWLAWKRERRFRARLRQLDAQRLRQLEVERRRFAARLEKKR